MNGGAGTNAADYSERSADLVITLCVDPALTGAPTGGGTGCADSDGDALLTENDNVVNCSTLYGGGGADTLTGTTTDDSLYGGLGDNVLNGGPGSDICVNDAVPTVAPVNCELQ
jgi:Ca2+-binding RTX toxin-like protein